MSKMADSLKAVPLFSELSDRELRTLSQSMHEKSYSEGQEVVTQGESGIGFFVILEGEARVSVGGQERRALNAGDYFGELGPLFHMPRSATARARTDSTVIGYAVATFRERLGVGGIRDLIQHRPLDMGDEPATAEPD